MLLFTGFFRVWSSVLQCLAVSCSVLQCAICCQTLQCVNAAFHRCLFVCAAVCCSVLQRVAHGWSGEGFDETSIHQIVVFCIFRFQSIWVGISGDNPSFGIHKRGKTHAVLRLANFVSPFLHVQALSYTRGVCHVLQNVAVCQCCFSQISFRVCCSVLQYAMCCKMCVNAAFHRFLFIDYRGHILCSHISSVVLTICFFCRISSLL